MKRLELIQQIIDRKEQLNITYNYRYVTYTTNYGLPNEAIFTVCCLVRLNQPFPILVNA